MIHCVWRPLGFSVSYNTTAAHFTLAADRQKGTAASARGVGLFVADGQGPARQLTPTGVNMTYIRMTSPRTASICATLTPATRRPTSSAA